MNKLELEFKLNEKIRVFNKLGVYRGPGLIEKKCTTHSGNYLVTMYTPSSKTTCCISEVQLKKLKP